MRNLMMAMMVALAMTATGCPEDPVVHDDAGTPTTEGDPCVKDSDCKSTSSTLLLCAYKISDGCGAKGHCAVLPSPTCASFTPLCGCDGSEVRSGSCMYAAGYASGPTTGKQFCSDGGL
jgi:hypothetical protein